MAADERLVDVAKRHRLTSGDPVVPQAYVPFIPPDWNGTLVLSESQNLSGGDYSVALRKLPKMDQIRRLGHPKLTAAANVVPGTDALGVKPWDDGSLKLACAVLFPRVPLGVLGVGNAVPWSLTSGERNLNPSKDLQRKAVAFWTDLLPVLAPKVVVVCGRQARNVLGKALAEVDSDARVVELSSASPRVMSLVTGMFPHEKMLKVIAEPARSIISDDYDWLPSGGSRQRAYACHAYVKHMM